MEATEGPLIIKLPRALAADLYSLGPHLAAEVQAELDGQKGTGPRSAPAALLRHVLKLGIEQARAGKPVTLPSEADADARLRAIVREELAKVATTPAEIARAEVAILRGRETFGEHPPTVAAPLSRDGWTLGEWEVTAGYPRESSCDWMKGGKRGPRAANVRAHSGGSEWEAGLPTTSPDSFDRRAMWSFGRSLSQSQAAARAWLETWLKGGDL